MRAYIQGQGGVAHDDYGAVGGYFLTMCETVTSMRSERVRFLIMSPDEASCTTRCKS